MRLFRRIKGLVDEVKPIFTLAESFSTAIETDAFDFEEPRAELKKLVDRLGHVLAQVDASKLSSKAEPLFVELMRMLARPTSLAKIREAFREGGDQTLDLAASALMPGEPEPVAENPRVQEWLAYLDGLHQRLPFATGAIIAHLPIWKPSFFWDLLELVHLLQQAKNTDGEKRARALKALARHVTENIHQRYVQGVEFAERLSQGRDLPKRESSYGAAINALVKEWGSAAVKPLIHPDAATLRNAASHMDRWHEDIDSKMIVIQDGSSPSIESRYTFDEMYDYCDRLSLDAAAFAEALLRHAVKLVGEIIVDTQLLEVALADFSRKPLPPEAMEEEKRKIGEKFRLLRERLAGMGAKETPKNGLPATQTVRRAARAAT